MSKKKRRVFGTNEWANETANCLSGCSHDCRYCYAKTMALRFKERSGKTRESWHIETPALSGVLSVCKKEPCKVMFPSTHDLTPDSKDCWMEALRLLIESLFGWFSRGYPGIRQSSGS